MEPVLPATSTGWKRGSVSLDLHTRPAEVPGLTKYGYGVSRLPDEPKSSHRLTHLKSGRFLYLGPQGVCRRLAEALHQQVPDLEERSAAGLRTLTADESKLVQGLIAAALEAGR